MKNVGFGCGAGSAAEGSVFSESLSVGSAGAPCRGPARRRDGCSLRVTRTVKRSSLPTTVRAISKKFDGPARRPDRFHAERVETRCPPGYAKGDRKVGAVVGCPAPDTARDRACCPPRCPRPWPCADSMPRAGSTPFIPSAPAHRGAPRPGSHPARRPPACEMPGDPGGRAIPSPGPSRCRRGSAGSCLPEAPDLSCVHCVPKLKP